MDHYSNYYLTQAGSGIAGYSGIRYQKGNGFFGRLVSGGILPLLRYLGKKALHTGVNVADDVLQGDDFKQSLKKQLQSTSRVVAKDAIEKVRGIAQEGSGMKRKKRQSVASAKKQKSIKGNTAKTVQHKARKVNSIKGRPRNSKGQFISLRAKKKDTNFDFLD